MKCQHCGSTDIISIQGQNYCLNCGYAVASAETAKRAPQAVAAGAEPAAAKPKLQHRGKSSHLEHLQPEAAAHHADDLTTKPKPKPSPASAHPLRFSLQVALSLGVALGLLVGGVLWFQLDSDSTFYALGLGLILSLLTAVMAQSALMFGVSRQEDGRPAPHSYWWLAARSGLMDVINVSLVTLICLLLIAGVGAAGWLLVAKTLHLSGVALTVVMVLINLPLLWSLVGSLVARRLAIPAVVIGGLTAWQGYKVGWRLYVKAGGHLMAAAIEASLGKLLAAAILGLTVYWSVVRWGNLIEGSLAGVIISSALVVAVVTVVITFVVLEVETRLWLHQYRQWVALMKPAERLRLLTGRSTSRPTP